MGRFANGLNTLLATLESSEKLTEHVSCNRRITADHILKLCQYYRKKEKTFIRLGSGHVNISDSCSVSRLLNFATLHIRMSIIAF